MPTLYKKIVTFSALAVMMLATSLAFSQQATSPAATAYVAKSSKLDRAAIDALLAQPEKLLIIDVRRPDELIRIGGFPVYLSIQSQDLEKNASFIPRDRVIVTVSNHAARALRSADLLDAKGFKVAGAIGAQDYEAQGGVLSRIATPAPKLALEGK